MLKKHPGKARVTSRSMDRSIVRACREDTLRTATDVHTIVSSPQELQDVLVHKTIHGTSYTPEWAHTACAEAAPDHHGSTFVLDSWLLVLGVKSSTDRSSNPLDAVTLEQVKLVFVRLDHSRPLLTCPVQLLLRPIYADLPVLYADQFLLHWPSSVEACSCQTTAYGPERRCRFLWRRNNL